MLSSCKPTVSLVRYSRDGEKIVAASAKLTLSSRDVNSIMGSMSTRDVETWIKELFRRGHGSPLEHSVYSFEITCSRVASHQIVRHRIASYTQLSQRRGDKILRNVVLTAMRYLDYPPMDYDDKLERYSAFARILSSFSEMIDGFDFDVVLEVVCQGFIIPPTVVKKRDRGFIKNLIDGLRAYYEALSKGLHPEDARFLLPQAVKTRIYVTMNARELIESFLSLRMCSHAQWEIRYIAWSMWKLLVRTHPLIFAYTGPRCVLYENRVRKELCTLDDFINGKCVQTIERCPEGVADIVSCIRHSMLDPWEQ